MDKIFSTRLDESIIQEIDRLSSLLKTSKKKLIEEMIRRGAREMDCETGKDFWSETSGIWKRGESPDKMRRKARAEFERSMRRHHG